MNIAELAHTLILMALSHELLHILLASLKPLREVLEVEPTLIAIVSLLRIKTSKAPSLPVCVLLLLLAVNLQCLQVRLAVDDTAKNIATT